MDAIVGVPTAVELPGTYEVALKNFSGNRADGFCSVLQKTQEFIIQSKRYVQGEEGGQFFYMAHMVVDQTNKGLSCKVIPFRVKKSFLSRSLQQIRSLIGVVFGGAALSRQERQLQEIRLQNILREKIELPPRNRKVLSDPFCQRAVIDKQTVFSGRYVEILYNTSPLGFGGERLHFLIVPNNHRNDFIKRASLEEIQEIAFLLDRVIHHFFQSRQVKKVHLFWKRGIAAGQSVFHGHLHVVFQLENKVQKGCGILTIVRNILCGSCRLGTKAFRTKVSSLRRELAYLNAN